MAACSAYKLPDADDLDEMNIEIMRNTLYKAYLDDFAEFTSKLGGATSEVMGDLLSFEVGVHPLELYWILPPPRLFAGYLCCQQESICTCHRAVAVVIARLPMHTVVGIFVESLLSIYGKFGWHDNTITCRCISFTTLPISHELMKYYCL